MSFAYTSLPSPLHSTADAAIKWFMDNWGVHKNAIEVEQQIHPDVELRPTFKAQLKDFHQLCIDVSLSSYSNFIDTCVVGCMQHGLPIKLFIATPKNLKDENYAHNLKAARRAGVGIIEVDEHSGQIVHQALSLSLNGVRHIDVQNFPKKYRQSISQAEQLFRDGTPEKACSQIYDEIEALFRKIAARTNKKGWWPNSGTFNIETVAWATLIMNWDKYLDRGKCPCQDFKPAFVARILGITPFRNDSGHKPKNQKALIKRNQQLRTRFEDSVDLFRDLIEAAKPLKI